MDVLKTISPTVKPDAPIDTPLKRVPSANAKIAEQDNEDLHKTPAKPAKDKSACQEKEKIESKTQKNNWPKIEAEQKPLKRQCV